jgi:hypothetical protein
VPQENCDYSTNDGVHCTHVLEYAGDHSKFCDLHAVFPERGSCPEGDQCTMHHTNPFFDIPNFDSMPHAVRARLEGRLSALSVLHSTSLYGGFVWARGVLNGPNRPIPGPVPGPGS